MTISYGLHLCIYTCAPVYISRHTEWQGGHSSRLLELEIGSSLLLAVSEQKLVFYRDVVEKVLEGG